MTLTDAREEARNDAARELEFRRDCREAAAEINNDLQAIMSQVEEIALKWSDKGWLNRDAVSYRLGATGQYVRMVEKRTSLAAAAHIAECVKETLEDALSLTAQEAREVASS